MRVIVLLELERGKIYFGKRVVHMYILLPVNPSKQTKVAFVDM